MSSPFTFGQSTFGGGDTFGGSAALGPSSYLSLAEAAAWGLTNVNTNQIIQASALIDAYLKRPEGLTWGPDSTGNPCYMTAAVQTAAFTLTAPIAPGQSVPVSLQGPVQMLQTGDVIVIDQPDGGLTEGCVIQTTTNPPNPSVSITLQNVLNDHVAGAPAALGLVIQEKKYMPASRPLTFMSRTPLMNVVSGVGRYGYGRRGDHADYNMEQFNLLAAVSKFGGPPVWELFQQGYPTDWDPETGQVWIPAGIMLAYYSEVKLRYVAGFPVGSVPASVKLATAQLIQAIIDNPGLGAMKSRKAGDSSFSMFAASNMSDDTKAAINLYAARAMT